MALTKGQKAWLGTLGPVQTAAASDEAKRTAKSDALAAMHKSLDNSRDGIREALQGIKVEMQPETFTQTIKDYLGFKETQALLTPDSNAMNEVDSFSDFSRQKITPKDAALATNVLAPIMKEFHNLLELTDAEGNLVYSPEDPVAQAKALAKDFWEPLVREGIIPENFVPQKYSEVERTFSAASDAYDGRLKEHTKELTSADRALSYFDLPVVVLSDLGTIASSAMVMEGAITAFGAGVVKLADNATYEEKKKHADIVAGVVACISSSKKAADAVFKKRDFQGAGDAMIAALGKILEPTLGKDLSTSVVAISTAASHAVPIGDAIARGDMPAIIKQMGAAIGDSLAASSKDKLFAEIGEVIKLEFEVMSKAVEASKDSTKAAAIMLEAAIGAGATAGKLIGARFKDSALDEIKKDKSLTKEESEKKTEKVKAFFSGIDSSVKLVGSKSGEVIKMPEALKALTEKADKVIDKEMVAALKEKAERAQDADLQKLLSTPDQEFQQMLAYGFTQDEDDPEGKIVSEELRLKSLETLLVEMNRQQKIYDLAKAISTGGIGAVEKFVPGLSAASAGTKTLFAFAEAIQKGQQMLVWFNNQKDAKIAVTVQYDAMMNRYGLAAEQTIVAGVQALVAAIDTLGKAMQMAGHLAPVGVAISAGAAASEALIDVSVKVTTADKMRKAWNIYQKALANPQDRKAAREALQTNPTLSKYAMAWGAVMDKNPIAESALLSCGIDAQTLATPGANVGAVVKFLEARFKDDPKLLREVPMPELWYPGPIELSMPSWLAFIKAAEDANSVNPLARGKFTPKGSDIITARLETLDTAMERLAAVGGDDLDQKIDLGNTAHDAAKALLGSLMRYKPVDKEGESHPGVQTYVDAMTEKAKIRMQALSDGVTKATKARKEAKEPA